MGGKKVPLKGGATLNGNGHEKKTLFWNISPKRTVKTIHSTLFFFLSRRKSLGVRLQPAVTFIDILCLLDYMQMKWDQI